MDQRELPFAWVMRRGDRKDEPLKPAPLPSRPSGRRSDFAGEGPPPSRAAALERMLQIIAPEAAVISTTGKSGRELFTLCDRPQHLYQVGSIDRKSVV